LYLVAATRGCLTTGCPTTVPVACRWSRSCRLLHSPPSVPLELGHPTGSLPGWGPTCHTCRFYSSLLQWFSPVTCCLDLPPTATLCWFGTLDRFSPLPGLRAGLRSLQTAAAPFCRTTFTLLPACRTHLRSTAASQQHRAPNYTLATAHACLLAAACPCTGAFYEQTAGLISANINARCLFACTRATTATARFTLRAYAPALARRLPFAWLRTLYIFSRAPRRAASPLLPTDTIRALPSLRCRIAHRRCCDAYATFTLPLHARALCRAALRTRHRML